ncbi:rRNA adenine N(6)-methyltransferase family protein [Kribbella monticola]|uniref:rRNA adenine N(6)-methyltransferase family protein n=1 Tax=Kribbella monticola TaxID=2185285 RepID=UPI000DD414B8|nr:rRNA adenine N(6)-methyltransferase family protein [Kribbella monticola]
MPGSGQARGAWGWHPLDSRWAQRVVDSAGISPGELVLDVGAGLGALTAPLVRAGAQVVAVELHPGRADRLRRRFADAPVTVVRADAADLRLPSRPFRVVSSPPYGISTSLLKRLLAPGSRLVSADLVLQRAVVNRWTAGAAPGAARWSQYYDLSIGIRLPRKAFTPPPHVDSAVLLIRRPIRSTTRKT